VRRLPAPFEAIVRADKAEVARLREVWSRDVIDDRNAAKGAELRRRAEALGEPASRALLAILVEHYADAHTDWWSDADRDERWELEGVLVGELASDATARVLACAVGDRTLAQGLRRSLVVALSRARFALAAEALARIACDRRDDPEIREGILCRFHRLGVVPPASLKDLLYQPYHDLDVLAAAMFAICGDAEAPSLVHEGLTVQWTNDDEAILALCAEAVRRITRKPLEFPHSYSITGTGREAEEAASRARVAPHVVALEEWMEANPPDTPYERTRRAYLEGPRRRREMSIRTVADVLAAGDDFDLAAASLWLTVDSAERVEASLERLDRLSRLCERRLKGVEGPEERIEALNGLLAQLPVREHHDERFASRISGTLKSDFGNCLARSTLYLGAAERLGLPLRAYVLPEHVYVAWEDGALRRNIETTDRGVERPGDGAPTSRPGVLSIHLSNHAATLLESERYAEALRCAEDAVVLDRANPAALCVRALATWQTDLDADPRGDLDRAAEILPSEPTYRLAAAEIAWGLGFPEDALRRAAQAFRMAPSPDSAAMLARAHLAAGDAAGAREVADEAAKRWPDAWGALAFVRFEMDLDRDGYAPLDRTDISPLWKAHALLKRSSPARALAQLDAAREDILGERRTRFEGNTILAVDQGERAGGRRGFRLLEARALVALGRIDEARESLRAAEEAAPPNRETLEVRRLLDGK
jgi:tetratricopeptide (TPR) repeat protein